MPEKAAGVNGRAVTAIYVKFSGLGAAVRRGVIDAAQRPDTNKGSVTPKLFRATVELPLRDVFVDIAVGVARYGDMTNHSAAGDVGRPLRYADSL